MLPKYGMVLKVQLQTAVFGLIGPTQCGLALQCRWTCHLDLRHHVYMAYLHAILLFSLLSSRFPQLTPDRHMEVDFFLLVSVCVWEGGGGAGVGQLS